MSQPMPTRMHRTEYEGLLNRLQTLDGMTEDEAVELLADVTVVDDDVPIAPPSADPDELP